VLLQTTGLSLNAYVIVGCVSGTDMLTLFLTHNITLKLYFNVQTVTWSPHWLASELYGLLIMVSGDFSQTRLKAPFN